MAHKCRARSCFLARCMHAPARSTACNPTCNMPRLRGMHSSVLSCHVGMGMFVQDDVHIRVGPKFLRTVCCIRARLRRFTQVTKCLTRRRERKGSSAHAACTWLLHLSTCAHMFTQVTLCAQVSLWVRGHLVWQRYQLLQVLNRVKQTSKARA